MTWFALVIIQRIPTINFLQLLYLIYFIKELISNLHAFFNWARDIDDTLVILCLTHRWRMWVKLFLTSCSQGLICVNYKTLQLLKGEIGSELVDENLRALKLVFLFAVEKCILIALYVCSWRCSFISSLEKHLKWKLHNFKFNHLPWQLLNMIKTDVNLFTVHSGMLN